MTGVGSVEETIGRSAGVQGSVHQILFAVIVAVDFYGESQRAKLGMPGRGSRQARIAVDVGTGCRQFGDCPCLLGIEQSRV